MDIKMTSYNNCHYAIKPISSYTRYKGKNSFLRAKYFYDQYSEPEDVDDDDMLVYAATLHDFIRHIGYDMYNYRVRNFADNSSNYILMSGYNIQHQYNWFLRAKLYGADKMHMMYARRGRRYYENI